MELDVSMTTASWVIKYGAMTSFSYYKTMLVETAQESRGKQYMKCVVWKVLDKRRLGFHASTEFPSLTGTNLWQTKNRSFDQAVSRRLHVTPAIRCPDFRISLTQIVPRRWAIQ